MKKTILLTTAAILLATVCATAQNKVDKQGRRQGHWVRTDKDGTKLYEADYVDGQETGTVLYYYPDGTVRMRNVYSEPGVHCSHEAFDEQGRLLARGHYDRRNRDGLWQFFADDGRLVKEANYRLGVKDGLHVVYTHSGDTAEVTHWRNNHRHGRWWKRLGNHGFITGTYVDGGLEGTLVEHDDNGLLAREGHYQGGLKHGSYRYYEGGQLTVDEQWQRGTLLNRRIRLLTPQEEFVAVDDIVCLAPLGNNKVKLLLDDGSYRITHEGADLVFDRLGSESFDCANRKSRIMVARRHVKGLGKDSDGRDILLLDPQPDFSIFPDEDGLKMLRSIRFEQNPVVGHNE